MDGAEHDSRRPVPDDGPPGQVQSMMSTVLAVVSLDLFLSVSS